MTRRDWAVPGFLFAVAGVLFALAWRLGRLEETDGGAGRRQRPNGLRPPLQAVRT